MLRYFKKKRPSDAYAYLHSPILEPYLSDSAYADRAAEFFAYEADGTFEQKIETLLKHKRFRGLFNAFTNRITETRPIPSRLGFRSTSRVWAVFRSILLALRNEVQDFAMLRAHFEQALADGQFSAASEALSVCEERHGASIWALRSRTILLLCTGKKSEISTLCEQAKEGVTNSLIKQVLNFVQLTSDSADANLILNSVVRGQINELVDAKQIATAGLLSQLFVPPVSEHEHVASDYTIRAYFAFPLCDLYILVVDLLRQLAVQSVLGTKPLPAHVDRMLKALAGSINDPALRNIRLFLTGTPPLLPASGVKLLSLYEHGDYGSAIKEYFLGTETQLARPAYLNLIAKATALGNEPLPTSVDASILSMTIDELKHLYNVSPAAEQAENRIASWTIRARTLDLGVFINQALLLAQPYRYSPKRVRAGSALALATAPVGLPLTRVMASSASDAFGAKYGETTAGPVPVYRQLKRDICSAVRSGTEPDTVDDLFRQLRKVTVLKKDFYELVTEYCLHIGDYQRLVSECADALVEDVNYAPCFPMRHLLQAIEDKRLVSLDAVLVAYFFVSKQAPELDYILNECVEEYLFIEDVERPTELVEKQQEDLSQKEIIFYRDVCNPDILDFLDCFQSVGELLSERVAIFEALYERGVLDGQSRTSAVEDVISRLLIETGTSEFNGPKIFVDDESIRKRHIEQIGSHLQLFRLAPETVDERVVVVAEEGVDTGKSSYVSGTRNAIILKIVRLILVDFLFDEKYGLDKNLSTEIRHGFFSNLMRARLAEYDLITEMSDKGHYTENVYWRNANALVKPTVWKEVDSQLRGFSARINQLIADAEGWMKIRLSGDPAAPEVFQYSLSISQFDRVRRLADAGALAEVVAECVAAVMWQITEQNLQALRLRLENEFRKSVEEAFEALDVGITRAKGGLAMRDLMDAIAGARNAAREDISTVIGWFSRVQNVGRVDQTLDRVIEIATRSFTAVKGERYKITTVDTYGLRLISVPGKSVKPLIVAIVNLLDNCFRHSGLGERTIVTLTGEVNEPATLIVVRNDLSEARLNEVQATIVLVQEKLVSPEIGPLMRVERGSGIVKAQTLVAESRTGSSIAVALDDKNFVVRIQYAK